jgi:NAD(P)-dependent dehydrogenase (short-subunit alcohol dehydrogenase family)
MTGDAGALDGQVAIVTGAAHGLGFATAAVLGDRGAAIVLVDINRPKLEAAAQELSGRGLNAAARPADLTVEEQVCALVADVVARYGKIDILVNFAAIQPPFVKFEDQTLSDWKHVLAATLDSSFLCCREALPHMKSAGYGRIVNTSSNSINAGGAGAAPYAPYVTAKAGVIGLTRALARETGALGITANVIMPGLTETEHTLAVLDDHDFDEGVAKQCVKRRGVPRDVADTVAFMVSREAGFLTGQIINVSGGQYFT